MVTGVAAGTAVISYSISQSCGSGYATTVVTVNVCNVGVKNIRGNGGTAIKLYPNPNNGAFTLFVSSQVDEQALITVTNILGEEVMEYTAIANKAVDIKLDKAAGIYFVNAVTANGRWCQKLTVIK
jgi:hypothetical protein